MLKFKKEEYYNGRLAIDMVGKFKGEIYEDTVSVNLVDCFCPEGYAYLDTNNFPFIADLITKKGIGEDTNLRGYSGFCSYPLFKIDLEKLA